MEKELECWKLCLPPATPNLTALANNRIERLQKIKAAIEQLDDQVGR